MRGRGQMGEQTGGCKFFSVIVLARHGGAPCTTVVPLTALNGAHCLTPNEEEAVWKSLASEVGSASESLAASSTHPQPPLLCLLLQTSG